MRVISRYKPSYSAMVHTSSYVNMTVHMPMHVSGKSLGSRSKYLVTS